MADYISREEAEQIICEVCERPGCPRLCGHGCNRIDRLNKIPAADVRPVVRGKWIKKGCYAFCSNCGERIAITWTTTVEELVNVYRLKFCNNCGADMRKVVEIDQVKEAT